MWVTFGDARRVPAIAFALAAVFAKSSTLYNPIVYLLLKPNFLNVITNDLSVFQAVCAMVCGICRTPVKQAPCIQDVRSPFMESRCCHETIECFGNYPQCCSLGQMDTSHQASLTEGKTQPANAVSASSVHLVVHSSRTKSTQESVEITMESLPPDCMKGFLWFADTGHMTPFWCFWPSRIRPVCFGVESVKTIQTLLKLWGKILLPWSVHLMTERGHQGTFTGEV